MVMEFEKSKLIELKEKFDSIINTKKKIKYRILVCKRFTDSIGLYTVEKFFRGNK